MENAIKSFDSIDEIDTKLRSKYKAGLFDFAYLLAISLNEDFLPQKYYGLSHKSFSTAIKILTSTKNKLSKYLFLDSVIKEIDNKLKLASAEEMNIHRYKGRLLNEKSKLILLWTSFLVKKYRRDVEEPYINENPDWDIVYRTIENISWTDFARLFKWFANKLSTCTYYQYLMQKPDSISEISFSKSIHLKDYNKTRGEAESKINAYIIAQEYFNKSSRNYGKTPIQIGRNIDFRMLAFGVEPLKKYPINLVGFNRDYIDIGERQEGKIILNRTTFLKNQKIYSKHEIDNSEGVSVPSIFFPNLTEHKFNDYSSPYDIPVDLVDKVIKEI